MNADLSTCISDFDPHRIANVAINDHGAQQNSPELAMLLSYLALVHQPRLIVELGFASGGLAWALRQLPCQPRVLSVSLPTSDNDRGRVRPAARQGLIWADTHDHATVDQVYRWLEGPNADLLVIDADHTYESAKADWVNYSPLVRPGGLIAFHDIAHADGFPDIQVRRLWDEIRHAWPTLELISDPHGLGGFGLLWSPASLSHRPWPFVQ